MNYTKGEWKVAHNCGDLDIVSKPKIIAHIEGNDIPGTESYYNAYLISQAPEMYEVFRILRPWFDKVNIILEVAEGKRIR